MQVQGTEFNPRIHKKSGCDACTLVLEKQRQMGLNGQTAQLTQWAPGLVSKSYRDGAHGMVAKRVLFNSTRLHGIQQPTQTPQHIHKCKKWSPLDPTHIHAQKRWASVGWVIFDCRTTSWCVKIDVEILSRNLRFLWGTLGFIAPKLHWEEVWAVSLSFKRRGEKAEAGLARGPL